jgi:SOS response regulatory protein OraA/RecX
VPRITRLRPDRRGRVAVELDGRAWRVLPLDVLARAGVVEGRELDRAALRLLRRELRRAEALQAATAALRIRDLSTERLRERLARRAVAPAAAEESLEVLARAGLVDDDRLARRRAEALAERGFGDTAIRYRLAAEAFPDDLAADAIAALAPEAERAALLTRRRGAGPRTARYLASRGFGDEAVEAALGAAFGQDP